MELKPGDVVTLKSGGHPLTVVEVNEDNDVIDVDIPKDLPQ